MKSVSVRQGMPTWVVAAILCGGLLFGVPTIADDEFPKNESKIESLTLEQAKRLARLSSRSLRLMAAHGV